MSTNPHPNGDYGIVVQGVTRDFGAVRAPRGGAALRRVEAAPLAARGADGRAAGPLPGRAPRGNRPRRPPRALEPALRAGGPRRHLRGDDPLHGRGGALWNRRLPLP